MSRVLCIGRVSVDQVIVRRHTAPVGVWICPTCKRTVYRGEAAYRMVRTARQRYGT